jgi:hypothetical protein
LTSCFQGRNGSPDTISDQAALDSGEPFSATFCPI